MNLEAKLFSENCIRKYGSWKKIKLTKLFEMFFKGFFFWCYTGYCWYFRLQHVFSFNGILKQIVLNSKSYLNVGAFMTPGGQIKYNCQIIIPQTLIPFPSVGLFPPDSCINSFTQQTLSGSLICFGGKEEVREWVFSM